VKGTVSLHELFEDYHERVQFLQVYIREAHPKDGWWLGGPLLSRIFKRYEPRASTSHYDPTTMEERRTVASECQNALQYCIPTYVDEMDDRVNTAYAGWPTRLYLIGLDGRVVYAGGLGPHGFKPAELKDAMDEYLESL
jgi:hypothetical protein